MGLFRSTKQAAEENAFDGATDWFKKQAKTAEAFNNEDKEMGGASDTKASSHLHSHRGQRQGRDGCSLTQVEQPEGDARRILQTGTARGNLCEPHQGNSGKAGLCREHGQGHKDASRTERSTRIHNQHFVKAA